MAAFLMITLVSVITLSLGQVNHDKFIYGQFRPVSVDPNLRYKRQFVPIRPDPKHFQEDIVQGDEFSLLDQFNQNDQFNKNLDLFVRSQPKQQEFFIQGDQPILEIQTQNNNRNNQQSQRQDDNNDNLGIDNNRPKPNNPKRDLLHHAHASDNSVVLFPGQDAQTTVVPIVQQESKGPELDGKYSFSYQSGDGSQRSEVSKPTGPETFSIQGSYSYNAPDGTLVEVKYVADENGFQVDSPNLPTPPPAPLHAILQIKAAEEIFANQREEEKLAGLQGTFGGIQTSASNRPNAAIQPLRDQQVNQGFQSPKSQPKPSFQQQSQPNFQQLQQSHPTFQQQLNTFQPQQSFQPQQQQSNFQPQSSQGQTSFQGQTNFQPQPNLQPPKIVQSNQPQFTFQKPSNIQPPSALLFQAPPNFQQQNQG